MQTIHFTFTSPSARVSWLHPSHTHTPHSYTNTHTHTQISILSSPTYRLIYPHYHSQAFICGLNRESCLFSFEPKDGILPLQLFLSLVCDFGLLGSLTLSPYGTMGKESLWWSTKRRRCTSPRWSSDTCWPPATTMMTRKKSQVTTGAKEKVLH